jgi:type VI secretion system protein ImpL
VLAHILQHYQPYLPFMILLAISLSIVAIFLLLVMGRKLTKRSAERMALARPPAARPSLYERLQGWRTKGVSFLEWCHAFKKKRLDPQESENVNVRSFKEAIDILKTFISDKEPEYHLPWYLLIGPAQSGKRAILEDIDLELPLGKPGHTLINQGDVDWWFYDQAVLIKAQGALFLSETGVQSEDDVWKQLIQLFLHYRPKRPLDGLILTIPATDLYGKTRLDEEQVMDRARSMYSKLWRLQSKLGMRLPVYVIITKCDIIPGFKSFVSETPLYTHNDMFGWSCPYSLETSFTATWVDDAFRYIRRSLVRARMAIFAEGRQKTEQDGNFLFASEFYQLKENLSSYLTIIFKESAYHESFFLRGIYFTGKAEVEERAPLTFGSPFDQAQEATTHRPAQSTTRREKVVFLRDLFTKKIFREASLAQPILRLMVSTNRRLNIAKAVIIPFVVCWSLAVCVQYSQLRHHNQALVRALQTVNTALKGVNQHGWQKKSINDDPLLLHYLEEQSSSILGQFALIENVDTFALSMPTSWLSTLDRRIEHAFTLAYNRIILPVISVGLLKRGAEIVSLQYTPEGVQTSLSRHLSFNPVYSSAFISLQSWIANLLNYEQAVEKYNNIEKTRSIEDLGYLIKYLFNKDLPRQFYTHVNYYKAALGISVEPAVDISAFKFEAVQKLDLLFKNFLKVAFDVSDSYPAFHFLQTQLAKLADSSEARSWDDEKLRNLVQAAIDVADTISSGQLSWVDKPTFDPAPAYAQLMNNIMISSLLGNDQAADLTQIADQEFVKFKLTVANFKSALTGPFFSVKNNLIVAEPSTGLVNFIDAATALLNEPFMAKGEKYSLVCKIPSGKLLFWDETALQKAENLIDLYQTYMTQRVHQAPQGLQSIFKMIARNSLSRKIISVVAQAQLFQNYATDYAGMIPREALQAQVHNMAAVTPHFTKILTTLEESALLINTLDIRQLLVEQTYEILGRINQLLEAENLYQAREEAFENWDGESMVGLKAFDVHDLTDMKNYLNAQRYRIQFLSRELAEPILTLLSLGFLEGISADLPLVFKWSRIAAVLQDYDKQSPANTLKSLEKFLTYDINEITINNCHFGEDDLTDFDNAGDYFIAIRNRYMRILLNRCQTLTGHKAIEHFNRAADFFNHHLAGRYPFTQDNDKAPSFEADPAAVATFYHLYDQLSQEEITALLTAARRSGIQDAVEKFRNDIENIRPLMLAMVPGSPSSSSPTVALKLQVAFRTDRQLETGGDKIIEWAITIGERKLDWRHPEATTLWKVGMPVDVNLRWALDADRVPVADPQQPSLRVEGPKAIFTYRGHWGLIRLLKTHGTPDHNPYYYPENMGQKPHVLAFQVPTAYQPACYRGSSSPTLNQKGETTRVFCRLTLQSAVQRDKNTDVPLKVLPVLSPLTFPIKAPMVEWKNAPSTRLSYAHKR